MKVLRERIETGFEQFAIWVFEHPWRVLAALALLLAFLVIQLPQLTVDVTLEGQFRKDDPTYQNYLAFKQQYGDDSAILVGIQSDNIFSGAFLETLRDFHHDLDNEMPYLDEMTSLINVSNIRAEEDALIVEDLLETWPQSEAEFQALKTSVMNYPAYQNILISEDGTFTAIYLIPDVRALTGNTDFSADHTATNSPAAETLSLFGKILKGLTIRNKDEDEKLVTEKLALTTEQRIAFTEKVREIAARYNADDFSIFITGRTAILKDHEAQVKRNMTNGIVGTTIGILILMFLIFRRVVPVVLTLLTVILSLLTMFGISSMLNIPIRTATLVSPPIILAAGICDAIHLFTIFFQRVKKGDDKKRALGYTMRHSGLAMLFTSLTTMGGFLAFGSSELSGIAELGLGAAIGVLTALVLTYLLIPALLALLPMSIKQKSRPSRVCTDTFWQKTITRLALTSTRHPAAILGIAAVIAIGALIGATQITMSFDVLTWFPKDEPVKLDTYRADAAFHGSSVLEVVIDTGRENGLFEPEVMNAIEDAQKFAEGLRGEDVRVGKTMSIVDTLKQINQVLNEDQHAFYTVPRDRQLIAQELFLFEMTGQDDLEDLVDSNFSQARLTLRVPSVDGSEFVPFRRTIVQEFSTIFSGKADFYLTGGVDLFVRSIWGLMRSMTSSYLLAGIVISLLLMLLTGSLRLGLIGMIPNFLPILIVLGIMGFTGIPISLFSVLLGGIALGLAVDDTVHFLHNFRRNFERTRNVLASVTETIDTIGRALFFTTLSLSIGFLAFLTSDLSALRAFGLLTGVTMIIALLSDLTVTPALVALLYRSQEQHVSGSVTEIRVAEA